MLQDATLNKLTILVVEDNPVNKILIKKQLALQGFDSDSADNGLEAVGMYAE